MLRLTTASSSSAAPALCAVTSSSGNPAATPPSPARFAAPAAPATHCRRRAGFHRQCARASRASRDTAGEQRADAVRHVHDRGAGVGDDLAQGVAFQAPGRFEAARQILCREVGALAATELRATRAGKTAAGPGAERDLRGHDHEREPRPRLQAGRRGVARRDPRLEAQTDPPQQRQHRHAAEHVAVVTAGMSGEGVTTPSTDRNTVRPSTLSGSVMPGPPRWRWRIAR